MHANARVMTCVGVSVHVFAGVWGCMYVCVCVRVGVHMC